MTIGNIGMGSATILGIVIVSLVILCFFTMQLWNWHQGKTGTKEIKKYDKKYTHFVFGRCFNNNNFNRSAPSPDILFVFYRSTHRAYCGYNSIYIS